MADLLKVIYGLWNGAIFNYLQRPLTQISTSHHYLINLSRFAVMADCCLRSEPNLAEIAVIEVDAHLLPMFN